MATTHQRTLIRKAVQALLTGRTVAEARVFATKVTPWRSKELPGISVYTLSDPVDSDSRQTAPRERARNLQLKIQCALQLADDIDDALDAFELQVSRAIDADPTFGGTASDAFLVESDIKVDPDADQPVGSLVLTYEVPYFEPAPYADDQAFDDLATVDAHTSLGGAQAPADQAHDIVTLETMP